MKTTQVISTIAALTAVVWLSGCDTTPESRIRNNPGAFSQLTPQEQALVQSGRVGLGFSAEAVKLALGAPDRVTLKTDATGQEEVWHYVQTVYYDGAFIYGGPYWGGWGAGWGRWGGGWGPGWRWGGYWGGPYPVGPVSAYERFRVVFRNNRVIEFSQEVPQ